MAVGFFHEFLLRTEGIEMLKDVKNPLSLVNKFTSILLKCLLETNE